MSGTKITVVASIDLTPEKVWPLWTRPEHIIKWNYASDDWCTTRAENDLRVGGRFVSRMESKDGTMGFDFSGTYINVILNNRLEYKLDDGRKVEVFFEKSGESTIITEIFDAENTNPVELQQAGWQAILNQFKKYAGEYYRNR